MIAREGLIFIFIGLVLTIGFIMASAKYDNKILFSFSMFFGLLTLFTVFFFRDPGRNIVYSPEMILSPADGKIIKIENIENNDFIGGPATKISIFLSVFDVHINRIPASGKIDFMNYIPGKYLVAYADKASDINERTEIGMTTDSGRKLIFKQIAGSIARRIVYYIDKGDVVTAGDRFGLIRFGSRMDLFLPADCILKVKIDDKVSGGTSVLAVFPDEIKPDIKE